VSEHCEPCDQRQCNLLSRDCNSSPYRVGTSRPGRYIGRHDVLFYRREFVTPAARRNVACRVPSEIKCMSIDLSPDVLAEGRKEGRTLACRRTSKVDKVDGYL